MIRAARAFAALVALAACCSATAARADDHAEALAAIDRWCAGALDQTRGQYPETFFRIYSSTDYSGTWHDADADSMLRIKRDPNIYSEVGRVWSAAGHVTIVEIEESSLDLKGFTRYCYRPSGTLSRVTEISAGTVNVESESRYLDENGAVIGTSTAWSLVAPHPTSTLSPDLRSAKPDLFLTVQALPFYDLL